ncbi:peptide chain release factor H, partial [Achromatium sp. WMS2]
GDLKSILLRVTGRAAQSLVANWLGTIQWIGVSPYRPHHKRKNWFVSIASFDEPDTGHWDTQLVKIEAMRASGPGGQHVNRTNSAVRVTHIPTNITTSAQEERSQHLNRRLALARLAKLLATRDAEAQQSVVDAQWRQHHSLIRGNPIRIYKGTDFTKLDM